ncbi:HSP90 family protein [Deinococcus hopiensis]|uniref:Molecular chaperone HtpG n=1 Tax=Deinococcus hopiensis KR-140 TaxID=695939 RepID=A0A1W1VMX5_9DEIO|nr:HSP90 family protein [Deinococcus hopiensis]SMB94633.1 molecular chaperone HtpG [Deinococcus hopiensis KR-140]
MEHAFKVDLRGIIDLLSNHLYSDPSVFVRELLQNGVDAITARRARFGDFQPVIEARLFREEGQLPLLEFRDNGVGLTEAEVHEFLATIGRSSKRIDEARDTFLGQFGIGLLSCFMVSGEIELLTRSATGSSAVRWLAQADGTYTLEALADTTLDVGTTVRLRAREDTDFYFEYGELRRALENYGRILPYPIHVTDGEEYAHVNAVMPPWLAYAAGDASKRDEVLAYAREELGVEALDAVALRSEEGGLLGVALVLPHATQRSSRQWHSVYLKRMLLGHDLSNLLPDWAFFVRCLLNVDHLHPTASRESFYEDGALKAAREALNNGLRGYIGELAERDPQRLEALISLHHLPLKALATEEDDFFRLLAPEFALETSTGRMKLGEYARRSPTLRMVTNLDQFRQIAQVASAYGHSVVNAVYTYDVPLLRAYARLFGRELEEVDAQTYALSLEDVATGGLGGVLERANVALSGLGCEVGVKRFAPAELPALLIVTNERRLLSDIEASKEVSDGLFSEFLDDYASEYEDVRASRLHLNLNHPLVQDLLHVEQEAVFSRLVQMLYVQAHLLGHHPLRAEELALLAEGLTDMMRWGLRATHLGTLN